LNETDFDYLDVSEYAAPEPLQMALEAVQLLTTGKFLHLHHRRYPRLLYERLDNRGFDYDTRTGPEESCKVFIWKKEDDLARLKALKTAEEYPPWTE